ncbi:MAG: ABC transporter substrate-binding protein [Actinomycetales bacterium]|nr:ABC transporter substrate-binding protein [Actinomycetales bacterium]
MSRRRVLQGLALGAGAVAASPLLAACGSSSDSGTSAAASGGSAAGGGSVTFGSNASDAVPKAAYQKVFDAFTAKTKTQVVVNTVDHNTFQEQINTYLQGSPDQAFTWFSGYRMRFFADQGLSTDISDVWAKIGSQYNESFKGASTGNDGKQYFVPFYYYPWALFYRKSVFKELGLDPSKITTIDELKAAGDTMKKAGLIPIAFADKDGWPAMGTFDYLNVRTNGYDFHVSLMAGKESWTDPKVKQVFTTWTDLLPYHQSNALGRTWQDAAGALLNKKAGMYLLGMFVGQQFPEGPDRDDLDFFPFPQIEASYGIDTVEAPIDGFMLSKSTQNVDGGKALLEYLGSPDAQNIYLASDPNNVGTNNGTDTSKYNALQKKAAELVGAAKHITQFLDRDTRPDFASTVMIPSLQKFIAKPTDIDAILESVEQQKQAIFTS